MTMVFEGKTTKVLYHSNVVGIDNFHSLGWSFGDIIPFLLVGAACGVASGLATSWGYRLNTYRKNSVLRQNSSRLKILEIAVVAMVTAAIFTVLPAIYPGCTDVPDDDRRRLSGLHAAQKTYVRYTCNDNSYSPLASLTLSGEEGAISHLFAHDEDTIGFLPPLLFVLVYIPCMVAALGTLIPCGTFVPM